jgi:hypothetical protein
MLKIQKELEVDLEMSKVKFVNFSLFCDFSGTPYTVEHGEDNKLFLNIIRC